MLGEQHGCRLSTFLADLINGDKISLKFRIMYHAFKIQNRRRLREFEVEFLISYFVAFYIPIRCCDINFTVFQVRETR